MPDRPQKVQVPEEAVREAAKMLFPRGAASETCRREFPERAYERCGKPAKYIVWGKLFPKEHLGPRCEDCAYDQLGATAVHRIEIYGDHAVYKLPGTSGDDEGAEG